MCFLLRPAVLALAGALAACGPGAAPGDPAHLPDSGSGVTAAAGDSLELRLEAPAQAREGDPIRFTLQVRNRASRDAGLYLLGREPTLDLEISRAGGGLAWRRLEGAVIPAILRVRTLSPGEGFEVSAEWDQRTTTGSAAGRGDYVATGLLLVESGALRSPPIRFRIEAR